MRKILSLSVMAIVLMASCSSNNDPESMGDTKESSINATSYTTWNYYSFANDTVVGKGEETTADNALWAKRADWDFAVCRYSVKTNSGSSTSVNAVGGVYTFASTEVFSNILSLPDNIQFVVDSTTVTRGMAGTVTTSKSKAQVIQFKANADGSLMMPPVYLQTPVYLFRTADGKHYYKLLFTQYKNENSETGHIKFLYARMK